MSLSLSLSLYSFANPHASTRFLGYDFDFDFDFIVFGSGSGFGFMRFTVSRINSCYTRLLHCSLSLSLIWNSSTCVDWILKSWSNKFIHPFPYSNFSFNSTLVISFILLFSFFFLVWSGGKLPLYWRWGVKMDGWWTKKSIEYNLSRKKKKKRRNILFLSIIFIFFILFLLFSFSFLINTFCPSFHSTFLPSVCCQNKPYSLCS